MADAEAGSGTLARRLPTLSPRRYRHLDRATKLVGLALVAAGLNAGGDTLPGLTLGVVGALVAVTTVFVRRHP